MFNLLTGIHSQTPVSALDSFQYGAAVLALAGQMEERLVIDVGENEHHCIQCIDALAKSLAPDLTVYEWMVAAAKKVGIDAGALRCI